LVVSVGLRPVWPWCRNGFGAWSSAILFFGPPIIRDAVSLFVNTAMIAQCE
jgi:hypothetical protein